MAGEMMEGRVAVVTGAAQGIGAAIVQVLLSAGASVAAVDLNVEQLGKLAAELASDDLGIYPTDVRDRLNTDATVDRVEREMGPIDILVNSAGVLRTGPILDMPDADWDYLFSVNASGVMHICRAVARLMIIRRRGAIVTVGSNAAGVPRMGMGGYAASKSAATMFTKCLGLELAEYGIRCNVVAAGSTDTPMQRAMWTDEQGARTVIEGSPSAYRVGIPLQRMGEPRDVAEAVLFLVSDRARHITMHDLYVDGGAALGV